MNSIELIGYLKEMEDKETRKVEIQLPVFNELNQNTMIVPCKYWAGGERNYLISLPINSHVAIRGHLNFDQNHQMLVMVEQLYCINKNENS